MSFYTIIYRRINPPVEIDELVRHIFYALVPWLSTYVVYVIISKFREHIFMGTLHKEIDDVMTQMGLQLDFSLIIIPLLMTLTIAYMIAIVGICFFVYMMLTVDFITYFLEITGGLLVLVPMVYFVFVVSSIFMFPILRFGILSKYLKQQIQGFHLFNELDGDLVSNNLLMQQNQRYIMNNSIFILGKQLQILRLSMDSSWLLFYVFLHCYIFLFATVIYVYIVNDVILFAFCCLVIIATPGFTVIIGAAQIVDYLVSKFFKIYFINQAKLFNALSVF